MAGLAGDGRAGCILGEGSPCPVDCIRAGRCVALRIRLRDGTERAGIPLSIVGETLRFREIRPREAVVLFALEGLEPGSREEVEFRLGRGARPEGGSPSAPSLATGGRPG